MTANATGLRVYSPFPVESLPRVWFWLEPIRHRMTDDFGPQTIEDMVKLIGNRMANRMQTWAVERDGELGGFISALPVSPIVTQLNCMFRREFFEAGTADEALRHVIRELFEGETKKIVTTIFKENWGIREMCHRVGMKREGTFEGHTMRGGKLVTVHVMGLTQEKFALCSDYSVAATKAAKLKQTHRIPLSQSEGF